MKTLSLVLIFSLLVPPVHADNTHTNGAAPTPSQHDVAPPSDVKDPIERINSEMESAWKTAGLTPAERADDFAFARRAYLDIVGRIPTLKELNEFMKTPADRRRNELCDQLVDKKSDFAPYWAKRWMDWLTETNDDNPNPSREEGMYRYLLNRFNNPKASWKDITSEMIGVNETPAPSRDPLLTSPTSGPPPISATDFLNRGTGERQRNRRDGGFDMILATNRTSRIFLGQQVQCAQCHDHPEDKRYPQARYWELNAFFRQLDFASGSGAMIDNPELNKQGFVYYEKRSGQRMPAYPRFLDGRKPDPSGGTRRQQLAGFVTSSDAFPKAFMNRLWAQFFGKGLNAPGDMDNINEDTTPLSNLLEGLGKDFKRNGYNMREAMRWICKSKPYGLSHRKPEKTPAGDGALYSYMPLKPLNTEQMVDSVQLALQVPTADDGRNKLYKTLFISDPPPTEDNNSGPTPRTDVQRALAMMNSPELHAAVQKFVKRTHGEDVDRSIRGYFLTFVGRPPSNEEIDALKSEVKDHASLEDLVTALLSSSHFQINH